MVMGCARVMVAVLVVSGVSGVSWVSAVSAVTPGPARPALERRLHLAGAEASSYLVNDWNRFQENYLPLYVGDDDPRTAWSLKTEGIGEWLRLRVTPMEGATRVRLAIRNGYQKTPKLFAANSRARGLQALLLPSKVAVDVELTDQSGWQEITIAQPAGAFEAVELRVKSVYPGKKYDDLCISDVQVYVTATSSDNPALEKQRLARIFEWKKERVAAAQLFRTKLGKTLPIAGRYLVHDPVETPKDEKEASCRADLICSMSRALARATALAANKKHLPMLRKALALSRERFATLTAVRVAPRDKRPTPTVDGLCTPILDLCNGSPCEHRLPLPLTGQLAYLDVEALALIEQTDLPALGDVLRGEPRQCHWEKPATFAWALREAAPAGEGAGRLQALLLASCGQVESREGPLEVSRPQLLVYGADGHLEIVAGIGYAAAVDWEAGADGLKLARGVVSDSDWSEDFLVEAAVTVANH